MTTATAQPSTALILDVPLDLVDESPTNARRTWGHLDELAANIAAQGQLQNGLARPKGKRFELVFGHRRKRAIALAKLPTIRLEIREMTDAQALEAQVTENLQRADLHPLEEAEGFEQLHKLGWTADAMAAKIGKSRGYVFGSMKLLALEPSLRKAFYDGKVDKSVALYLARIPSPELQRAAFKDLEKSASYGGGEKMPGARRCLEIIQQKYMLRLADAPFDKGDKTLVPKAGACKDCPKRTGNQAELFADVKSADVCTDPECFAGKVKADGARRLKTAADKGVKVLEGPAALKAIEQSHYYGMGTYVRPTEKAGPYGDGPTFGSLAKGTGVKPVLAVGKDGQPVELLPRTSVLEAAKKSGKLKAPKEEAGMSQRAQDRKRKKAAQRKRVATVAVVSALLPKVAGRAPSKAFWSLLAGALVANVSHGDSVEIMKRRRKDAASAAKVNERDAHGSYSGARNKLKAAAAALDEGGLRALCLELAIAPRTYSFSSYGSMDLAPELKAAAKLFGVDVRKVGAAALKAAAAPKKKAAPKGKK